VKSNASATRPLYSGELARLTGVSTDTLRHYERQKLLPPAPRSAAGYRLFPPEALNRVKLIRGALSIGFSISELAAIFRERDRGGAPSQRVRKLAAEKLVAVETRLRELQSWRRELRGTLAGWDRLLLKTPHGQRAGLLEAFVATHPKNHSSARARELVRGNGKKEKQQ
jgi:MerR family Zn(II)-responsive transcriptional regulator of zntA